MFDGIYLHHQVTEGPDFDLGVLAEAMLFYRRVYAVGGLGTVEKLLQYIPPFVLLGLLEDGRLALRCKSDHAAVMTENTGTDRERHSFTIIQVTDQDLDDEVTKLFLKATGSTSQAKLAVRRFVRLTRPIGHEGFDYRQAANDVQNNAYAVGAVRTVLRSVAPEYELPNPFHFHVDRRDDKLVVDTNIDFAAANRSYHLRVSPTHSSLNQAMLLANLQTVSEDLYYSSLLSSEISATSYKRALLQMKVDDVIRRTAHSEAERARFNQLVLEDAFAIREAVNTGNISWAELRKLYNKANRFRGWLQKTGDDEELIAAYYKEVVRETWVEKLPGKTTRWAFFTGVGVAADAVVTGGIGTALGVGLSAIDTFWLDRILKGWKPNQFVEGELKRVLKKS